MANGAPTPRRRGLAVGLGFAAASGTRNAGLPIRAEGMVNGRAVREAERGGMENLRAAVAAAAGVGRGTIATRTRNLLDQFSPWSCGVGF